METAAVGMQTSYAEQFTPLGSRALLHYACDHGAEKIGLRNVHRANPMEGYLPHQIKCVACFPRLARIIKEVRPAVADMYLRSRSRVGTEHSAGEETISLAALASWKLPWA